MVVGNLEMFKPNLVTCWVVDTELSERVFKIHIIVNNLVVDTVESSVLRDDVRETYGVLGSGFSFRFDHLLPKGICEVTLQIADSSFQFSGSTDVFVNGRTCNEEFSDLRSDRELFRFDSDFATSIQSSFELYDEASLNDFGNLASETKFIFVLFSNRTGSNLVTDMLEQMGYGCGSTNEPFLAGAITDFYTKHSPKSILQYFNETIRHWKKSDIFFCKIGWDSLFYLCSHRFFDPVIPKAAFLFCRRRNKIKQAISYIKAIESGSFFLPVGSSVHPDGTALEAFWDQPDRFTTITRTLHEMHVADSRLEYFFSLYGAKYLEIFYEDMCDDLVATSERIQNYVSLTLDAPKSQFTFVPTIKKQAKPEDELLQASFYRIVQHAMFDASGRSKNDYYKS